MRFLLIFILTIPLFAQNTDYKARERIVRLEQQFSALKENQQEIKDGIGDLDSKLEYLFHGHGTVGLSEQVAINTAFRQDMQKLFWGITSAITIQFVLTIFSVIKMRKLTNGKK
jgi:predicted nuclease with TOPRIM domain